jgi:hypothetical protein
VSTDEALRARLTGTHAHYLNRPQTDSRRLTVEAIIGMIGDLADENGAAEILRHAPLHVSPARHRAIARRVAHQAATVRITITWDDEPDGSQP